MSVFFCPTQAYLEPFALTNNAEALRALGKRCLIVTGKTSAAASGAMDDLSEVLSSIDVAYDVYDEIEPNPSIHTCHNGGQRAKDFGAEYIFGIGGGSALDAAKAIAAYAANEMEPMGIYQAPASRPLSVAAIPTTAGTGSEVNGYAILTIPELGVKRTYSSPAAFPAVAFLDPRYTVSLPYSLMVSTALDAFCHCSESYFSPKATHLTRALSVKGVDLIWCGLMELEARDLAESVRLDLLTGAMLGGMCIAHTGTGYPHPMGYNLSLYHGLPHGTACALFEGGYLHRQTAAAPDLFGSFAYLANLPDVDSIAEILEAFAGKAPVLTDEEIERYAGLIVDAKNFSNSISPVPNDVSVLSELYRSLGGTE